MCFPIEVKSSKKEKIYVSGRTMEEYSGLKSTGEECGLVQLYGFRLKGVRGDSWRIMKVEVDGLRGKLRHLSRSISSVRISRRGKR
jgi:Archaeal holliday junction resolvase (hjc).